MDKDKEKELVKQLKSLNEIELCIIFYKAVASLKKVREEFGEIDDAYCITISGYSDRDGVHESNFWALPKENIESFSSEEINRGAGQFGECTRCKVQVVSIGKTAICPICGTDVDCT